MNYHIIPLLCVKIVWSQHFSDNNQFPEFQDNRVTGDEEVIATTDQTDQITTKLMVFSESMSRPSHYDRYQGMLERGLGEYYANHLLKLVLKEQGFTITKDNSTNTELMKIIARSDKLMRKLEGIVHQDELELADDAPNKHKLFHEDHVGDLYDDYHTLFGDQLSNVIAEVMNQQWDTGVQREYEELQMLQKIQGNAEMRSKMAEKAMSVRNTMLKELRINGDLKHVWFVCTMNEDFTSHLASVGCPLTQSMVDDGDWTLMSRPPRVTNTGPKKAYGNTAGGGYLMLNSRRIKPGRMIRLNAPRRPSKDLGTPVCVSFVHSMYGANIGWLTVEEVSQKGKVRVWKTGKIGDLGFQEWRYVAVKLSAGAYSFSITAYNGRGSTGDIAIDHIIARNNVIDCDYPVKNSTAVFRLRKQGASFTANQALQVQTASFTSCQLFSVVVIMLILRESWL